eukprot:9036421-Pyramimonas_sp.AAC.2
MSPLELAKCGFIEKVGAYVFVSDIEHTCVTGSGGSHIDFMLASKSACPLRPRPPPHPRRALGRALWAQCQVA